MNQDDGWKNVECYWCGSSVKRLDGSFMRKLRIKKKLTMKDMGKRAGFSVQFISDVERNRRNCPRKLEGAYLRLQG